MPGLPFEQLPAGRMTPESMLMDELKRGEVEIRKRYDSQWKEINRRVGLLGEAKAFEAFNQTYSAGQDELNKYKEEGNRKLAMIKQVDTLASHGFVSNPDEVKWRMILGPETESAMFPREKSVTGQFSELDTYETKLRSDLSNYRELPAGKTGPRKFLGAQVPFTGGELVPPVLERKDPTQVTWQANVSGEGGKYVPQWNQVKDPEEIQEYGDIKRELKLVQDMKQKLMQAPNVANRLQRIAAKSTLGEQRGSFDDKIKISMPEQNKQPTASELRKAGTQEAFEQGRQLGYW